MLKWDILDVNNQEIIYFISWTEIMDTKVLFQCNNIMSKIQQLDNIYNLNLNKK